MANGISAISYNVLPQDIKKLLLHNFGSYVSFQERNRGIFLRE